MAVTESGRTYPPLIPSGYLIIFDMVLSKRTPLMLQYVVFDGTTLIAVRPAHKVNASGPITLTFTGMVMSDRPPHA